MSELLLRGWNVSVPVVDVGDDVILVDDRDKTTFRLQVKTAAVAPAKNAASASRGELSASFKISRAQLREVKRIELFYMLVLRHPERWQFALIPRDRLSEMHDDYLDRAKAQEKPARGRPPKGDGEAEDGLRLVLSITAAGVSLWKTPLDAFVDAWPEGLAPILDGPGTVGGGDAAEDSAGVSSGEDPLP
ncbi:hypothetical protein L6R52_22890 [Myxococcota bacterium]|nr:hypothetical protein [Myxococcota bacterium]